jgi:hypothetical protein
VDGGLRSTSGVRSTVSSWGRSEGSALTRRF